MKKNGLITVHRMSFNWMTEKSVAIYTLNKTAIKLTSKELQFTCKYVNLIKCFVVIIVNLNICFSFFREK